MASSKKPSDMDHFFAGLIGGTAAAISTNWLEIVKTRQQSAGVTAEVRNMRVDRILRQIVKQEGPIGLFRGVGASIIGVGPARACQFYAYNKTKQALASVGIIGTTQHALAACIGSFAAATATSPIWVVKTRLQLQQDAESLGVAKWSKAGGNSKRSFSTATGRLCRSSAVESQIPSQLRASQHLTVSTWRQGIRGDGVGPLAVLRRRWLSTAAKRTNYTGLWHAFKSIYKEEGITGFYRGLTASYLGAAESMIQFALYQQLKAGYLHVKYPDVSMTEGGLATASTTTAGYSSLSPKGMTPAQARAAHRFGGLEAVVLGAGAKLVAAASVYPQEVIRTRMREQRESGSKARYRGVAHCLVRVAREEGMAGLYGGMPAHLIRVVPNAAVLFLVVETMLGGAI